MKIDRIEAGRLSHLIAEDIMKLGSWHNSPCQRIQFKGGKYPNKERDQGGINKAALISVIYDSLIINGGEK